MDTHPRQMLTDYSVTLTHSMNFLRLCRIKDNVRDYRVMNWKDIKTDC